MSSHAPAVNASGRVGRALQYLSELWRRREFALALGLGNLKARNASTSLGLFWWVLNPLLLGGVYFIVFGLLFGSRRPPDFLPYLLSGMFVFHFTSQSMTGGANSIIQNSKLLANLRFPRLILPISALVESFVGFIVSLGVFAVIAAIAGAVLDQQFLTYRLLYLPAIIAVHLIFNLGLSALMARLAVPFRDINNLTPYINRIWLYVSPIIWPLSLLESDAVTPLVMQLIKINPMWHIIGVYRSALLGYTLDIDQVIGSLVWSALVVVFGVLLFVRYEGHMVRHL